MGLVHWAKVHNPAIVEGDHCLEQGHTQVQMHVNGWTEAQREDPMLSAVLDLLEAQKKTDLKVLLAKHVSSEEGWLISWNQQNFTIHQGALYLWSMPKDLLFFLVPKAQHVAALNGCHRDAGHQGHNCTLSLLWECFWWLGMANQMQWSIKTLCVLLATWGQLIQSTSTPNCGHCSYGPLVRRLY